MRVYTLASPLPFALFALLPSSTACSSHAPCVVGEQPVCGCPGGLTGVQTCGDDGTFGACQCPEPCVPRTCEDAASECGVAADGCGGTIPCGACDADRVCSVSDSGNTCVCAPGTVELDGACDLDECATGLDNCDSDATCTNTAGGFSCACTNGTVGDGTTCDEDQCAAGSDTCDPNATCTDLPTGFLCACPPGFLGNGFSCVVDVDNIVADLTSTPVSVSIADVGTFAVRGMSRIALEIESRLAVDPDFVPDVAVPFIAAVSTPPVTMARVAGDSAEAAALLAADASIHDVDVALTNVFGERVTVRLHAIIAITDPTVTVAGDESAVAALRLTPLEPLRFIETVRAARQNLPQPAGGFRVEIDGITGDSNFEKYLDNEVDVPPVGEVSAPAIRNLRDIESIATWVNIWVHVGLNDRRAMSFIDIVGDNTEVARRNCFELMPTELVVFNPEKTYGASLLGDLRMVAIFCEDA